MAENANTRLRENCLEAMRRGIEFARAHFIEPPIALDAEATHPDDMPADQRSRLLAILRQGGIDPDPYLDNHIGDEPTPADLLTHREIVTVLRHHYPSGYFAGEEAPPGPPARRSTSGRGLAPARSTAVRRHTEQLDAVRGLRVLHPQRVHR